MPHWPSKFKISQIKILTPNNSSLYIFCLPLIFSQSPKVEDLKLSWIVSHFISHPFLLIISSKYLLSALLYISTLSISALLLCFLFRLVSVLAPQKKIIKKLHTLYFLLSLQCIKDICQIFTLTGEIIFHYLTPIHFFTLFSDHSSIRALSSVQVAPPVLLNHYAWCPQLGHPCTTGKQRNYPSRFRLNITFLWNPLQSLVLLIPRNALYVYLIYTWQLLCSALA